MQFKMTKYYVAIDALPDSTGTGDDHVIFATRTGMTAKLDGQTFEQLQAGRFDDIPTSTLVSLCAMELVVPTDEDEFYTMLQRNKDATLSNRVLDVTIQPTADCQLGCTYCGQQHRKTSAGRDMQQKILDRILGNLDRGGYNSLSVQWFGAEPLMAYSTILKMSETLIAACAARSVQYRAQMITNGLSLKPMVFRALSERAVTEYQITLDGTASTHNSQRMTKTGRPAFDTILSNIVAVTGLPEYVTSGSVVVLRMNVNRSSADEISSLIDQLAALGLQHRQVYLDFQPVVNWGDNEASQGSFSADVYAEKEIEWIMQAMDRGFRFGQFLPSRRFSPCMVVQPDGEVYDADGNIFPCYEFPYTPVFEGSEYKIGHVDTIDRQRNDQAVTREWFNDLRGDIAPCKHCNLYPVCGGGCPKKWLHGERACPSFKDNIQDRLALHYLFKAKTGELSLLEV